MGVFGSLGGGLGGLIASAVVPGGDEEYQRAQDLIDAIKDPNFDFSKISPEDLQIVAKYSPETYNAVVPDSVKVAQDSPEMRQALAEGVQKYRQISQEGLPESERLAAQGAMSDVRQAHRQALESTLRDLRERGRAGGGSEIALRGAAGQQAANLAAQQGAQLSQQSTANRMAGLEGYSNLAGQTRGQDIGLSQSVANDYNTFARYISNLKTQAAANAAQSRQAASNSNVTAAQNTANYNRMNRQQTAESNLNRYNTLTGQLAQFRMNKALQQANQRNRLGWVQDANKAAIVDQVSGLMQGVGGAVDQYYGQGGFGGSSGSGGY